MKKTIFEIVMMLAIVAFVTSLFMWSERDMTNECLDQCFIKDGEPWCPIECWDVFEEKGCKPNPAELPTECQAWGFGYGCS